MYKILCKDGSAKRGRLETVHGTIETPVFMNVATVGAMKGAVSTEDLQHLKTQVVLSNTYHLHVRPGDEIVKKMGGLHTYSYRFRRISGFFACRTQKDKRGRRLF